jgi:hypothetical protein
MRIQANKIFPSLINNNLENLSSLDLTTVKNKCKTINMPGKKIKSKKSKARNIVRKPKVTSLMGPQYDTRMIVTILLLIFIYPVGLIFMWAWMKSWPVWLKFIISLPLLISLFFVGLIIFTVGKAVKEARYQQMMGTYQNQMYQNSYSSPTVSPYKTY